MGRRGNRISQRLARLERAAPEGPPTIREIVVYGPDGKGGLWIETMPLPTGETTRRQATEAEARQYYTEHLGLDYDEMLRRNQEAR